MFQEEVGLSALSRASCGNNHKTWRELKVVLFTPWIVVTAVRQIVWRGKMWCLTLSIHLHRTLPWLSAVYMWRNWDCCGQNLMELQLQILAFSVTGRLWPLSLLGAAHKGTPIFISIVERKVEIVERTSFNLHYLASISTDRENQATIIVSMTVRNRLNARYVVSSPVSLSKVKGILSPVIFVWPSPTPARHLNVLYAARAFNENVISPGIFVSTPTRNSLTVQYVASISRKSID